MALDERDVIRDRRLLVRSRRGAGRRAGRLRRPLRPAPRAVDGRAARRRRCSSRCPGSTPTEFLEDVEWPTLVFFMGLFIMVGALVEVGVIGRSASAVTDAVGDRYLLASSALLWGSAVLSGIVDNIPYVATMTPLVAEPGRRRARQPGRDDAVVGPGPRRRPRRQRHRGRAPAPTS